jgi:hypothetical protein
MDSTVLGVKHYFNLVLSIVPSTARDDEILGHGMICDIAEELPHSHVVLGDRLREVC